MKKFNLSLIDFLSIHEVVSKIPSVEAFVNSVEYDEDLLADAHYDITRGFENDFGFNPDYDTIEAYLEMLFSSYAGNTSIQISFNK